MKADGDTSSGSIDSGGVRGLYGLNVAAMVQNGHAATGGGGDGSNMTRQLMNPPRRAEYRVKGESSFVDEVDDE